MPAEASPKAFATRTWSRTRRAIATAGLMADSLIVAKLETDPEPICTQCGLCCDGTMFDIVGVDEEESEALTALGFELEPRDDSTVFRQPCHFLSGELCSIYSDRPHTCRRFRCKTLRALETGDLTREDALARIAQVRRLLAEMIPLLRDGETLAQARKRWKAALAVDGGPRPPLSGADAELALKMTVLNLILDRQFRPKDQQQMMDRD